MCTVTIVPHGDGFRLACNRDERRDRAIALRPRLFCVGSRLAVYPVDPEGGGTWVGMNDAGLAAALLNRTVDPALDVSTGRTSRGAIVPAVLSSASLRDALMAALSIDARQFNPFRLLVIQQRTAFIVTSDGHALSHAVAALSKPLLVTSSSLGDAVVAGPRRRLFEWFFAGAPSSWVAAQDAFHGHRWPDAPDISVRMERPAARTVSMTTIDARHADISLAYAPVNPEKQSEAA